MICPKCKAEYRQGYASCADCHVLLVNHLPAARQRAEAGSDLRTDSGQGSGDAEAAPEPGDPNRDPFCSFWKGTDLRICTEICAVLDEAGIPQKTIRRQDHLFNWNHQAPYEVGVPASLYEKAELAIKDAFGSGEGENPPLLTEKSSASFRELIDWPIKEKVRGREVEDSWGLSELLLWRKPGQQGEKVLFDEMAQRVPVDDAKWPSEDASSRVWDGEPVEARGMIELSLRENEIGMRWEGQGATTKLYVLPGDEQRAKEIVREIVEGTPI